MSAVIGRTLLLLIACAVAFVSCGDEDPCDVEGACVGAVVQPASTDRERPVAIVLVSDRRGADTTRTVLVDDPEDSVVEPARLVCDTGRHRPPFGGSFRDGELVGFGPDAEFDRLVRRGTDGSQDFTCRLEGGGADLTFVPCSASAPDDDRFEHATRPVHCEDPTAPSPQARVCTIELSGDDEAPPRLECGSMAPRS